MSMLTVVTGELTHLATIKTALTFLAIIAAYALAERLRFLRTIRNVPGPAYSFWLGAIAHMAGGEGRPSFYTQRHLYLRQLHAKYGPVVKLVLPFGRGATLCFSNAATAEQSILKDSASFNVRPGGNGALPRGILQQPTNDVWRAHRHALLPALSSGALRSYFESVAARAQQMSASLRAQAPPPHGGDGEEAGWAQAEVSDPLVASTLDVIGDIGFGVDFGALEASMAHSRSPYIDAGSHILAGGMAMFAVPCALARLVRALPKALQPASQSRMLEAIRLYAEIARKLYDRAGAPRSPCATNADRPQEGGGAAAEGSLLKALARAELPFEDARDHIIALLIAGHETTANTLSWALHLLAHDPAEQARLRAVLLATLGDGPLAYEHVAQLSALRDVFYEALRLYPTVPSVGRLCTRATTVGGVHVPRGAVCMLSVAVAARDPSLFSDAEEFCPARHAQARAGPARAQWCPFGGGPRMCLGFRLAELEAVTFLATVLREYELAPPLPGAAGEDLSPEEFTDVTLGPKRSGLRVRVRPIAAKLSKHQVRGSLDHGPTSAGAAA